MSVPAQGFAAPDYDWSAAGGAPANDNDGNAKVLTFKPVGPVARQFVNDRAFISSIMGPYGSAKTTSCFQKILNCLFWQKPGPDGIRRIRVAVVRATYGQLQKNVMPDWFGWFPKTKDNWNGDEFKHTVRIELFGLGTGIIEILFIGLGELKAEEVFKGMKLTLLWLNEVDTLDRSVLTYGMPRVGRYPEAKDGGCQWSGVIADFNAPEVDNYAYDLFVNKNLAIDDGLLESLQKRYGPEFRINFHRQPGGLEPDAENLGNLPEGYYERLILGFAGNENKIRRFVHNQFGAVNNGQPVYPEFRDNVHAAPEGVKLQPLPGVPITIGLDGGMTPAAVFIQEDARGRVLVLDELVIVAANDDEQLDQLGATNFGRECREFVSKRFPNAKIGAIWGDPSGFEGGDDEDLAWMLKWGKAFGARVKPAPGTNGNRITPRLEAVRGLIVDKEGQVKLGLLVGADCRQLRKGFNNGYVLTRVKYSNGSGRTKDVPLKNDSSHVHDALQYGVLGLRKKGQVLDSMDAREALRRQRANVSYGGDYFSGRAEDPRAAAVRAEMLRERRVGRAR